MADAWMAGRLAFTRETCVRGGKERETQKQENLVVRQNIISKYMFV